MPDRLCKQCSGLEREVGKINANELCEKCQSKKDNVVGRVSMNAMTASDFKTIGSPRTHNLPPKGSELRKA